MRFGLLACAISAFAAETDEPAVWHPASDWPILKTYDRDHLYRIGLPVGGIGTGTVTFGGRGEWRNVFELMNDPAENVPDGGGWLTRGPCFLVHVEGAGVKLTRMLAGPPYPYEYQQWNGQPFPFHGLPRFAEAEFRASYPFAEVALADATLPVKSVARTFNPFVPGDVEASSLPVAVMDYEIANTSSVPLVVSVCGTLHNIVGCDVRDIRPHGGFNPDPSGAKGNRNVWRRSSVAGAKGLWFHSDGVATNAPGWGSLALTVADREGDVTYRTSTRAEGWNSYVTLLDLWDDFDADGALEQPRDWPQDCPRGALAVRKTVAPGTTGRFTFYLTWSFPNRRAWSDRIEGNFYAREFPDAWTAQEKIVPRLPELERRTRRFVEAFLSSSLPDVVKEAMLFNLATLRSQTIFRIADGHVLAWEGTMDRQGSCFGSCTHVWAYAQALPYLFPELERSMLDVAFNCSMRDDGRMAFRARLPLAYAKDWTDGVTKVTTAADGQMGCILRAYRDWRFSGDTEALLRNWPRYRAALAWAWTGADRWDADADGVMEGAQGNTWDVIYHGPNPEVGFWYLGALRAGEEMARAVGDAAFAAKVGKMAADGAAWMDRNLFNGEYYEQLIHDPETRALVSPGQPNPPWQMGRGCFATQLSGQFMADVCGLGALADVDHRRRTLESLFRYNFHPSWKGHCSNARTFVFEDEGGLAQTSWPHGREAIPPPCWAEAWTGVEYATAVEMAFAGMTDEALRIVRAVRSRFDGAKRNPYNEPECGNFYGRCLSCWGLLSALSGFDWDGRNGTMSFADVPGRHFWAVGGAWGTCDMNESGAADVQIAEGDLNIRQVRVRRGHRVPADERIETGRRKRK